VQGGERALHRVHVGGGTESIHLRKKGPSGNTGRAEEEEGVPNALKEVPSSVISDDYRERLGGVEPSEERRSSDIGRERGGRV